MTDIHDGSVDGLLDLLGAGVVFAGFSDDDRLHAWVSECSQKRADLF